MVNQLNGREPVPTDPATPVFRRGVAGRPTLLSNAETMAQLALIARYGADWFRSQGLPEDPGTFLITLTHHPGGILPHPGVLEIARGTRLREVLRRGGVDPAASRPSWSAATTAPGFPGPRWRRLCPSPGSHRTAPAPGRGSSTCSTTGPARWSSAPG